MKTLSIILAALAATVVAHAQLVVTVSPSKIAGQKTIVPLSLRNGLAEKVASACAVMFLLDSEGKVAGQASHWIIGGDTNHPPLAVGATNTYHFVVSTSGKAFVTNRLTVTHVKLANGKTANPVTDVEVRYEPKR
jgi:hypothetical protein